MAKPKAFVSHSSIDNDFAVKFVADLNAAGAQAWMDVNDLSAGNFQRNISEALADCEWFVLVLTRHALTSNWVPDEVDAANHLKKQGKIKELIFIKAAAVDPSELPPLWGIFNIFDATVNYQMALNRTLQALGLSPTHNVQLIGPEDVAYAESAVYAGSAGTADVPPRNSNSRGLARVAELEGRLGMASYLLSTGEYADALQQFEEAINVIESAVLEFRESGFDPTTIQQTFSSYYSQAWRGKSMALSKLGRFLEAMKASRRGAKGLPF